MILEALAKYRPRLSFYSPAKALKAILRARLPKSVELMNLWVASTEGARVPGRLLLNLFRAELPSSPLLQRGYRSTLWKRIYRGMVISEKELQYILKSHRIPKSWSGKLTSFSLSRPVAVRFAFRHYYNYGGVPVVVSTIARPRKIVPIGPVGQEAYRAVNKADVPPLYRDWLKKIIGWIRKEQEVVASLGRRRRLLEVKQVWIGKPEPKVIFDPKFEYKLMTDNLLATILKTVQGKRPPKSLARYWLLKFSKTT